MESGPPFTFKLGQGTPLESIPKVHYIVMDRVASDLVGLLVGHPQFPARSSSRTLTSVQPSPDAWLTHGPRSVVAGDEAIRTVGEFDVTLHPVTRDDRN